MKRLLERFNQHGLFIKMFLVMVISIVTVSVIITFSTIRMSERLFMETFSITNSKVINHIKTSFESFSYSIVKASNNIQQSGKIKSFLTDKDTNSMSMMKAYYSMDQQMSYIHSNVDAYELNIVVAGINGRMYSSNYAYWPVSAVDLRKYPITDQKKLTYHYLGSSENNQAPMIVASKALVERSTGNIYGSFYIGIREKDFKQFYSNYTSYGNDVVVLDRSGVVVSSNKQDLLGQEAIELLHYAKEIEESDMAYIDADVMGKNHIVLAEYLPSLDMYLVNLINKEIVMHQLINKKAIVLISTVIVVAALLIVFLISRRLTRSLRKLVNQISNMAKYDFDKYVSVNGSYETRQLAQAFNFMLDELHNYVDELIQTQKKQRNAELEALQQQINPHFLYNTLTSVKIMVKQGNQEKAAETINALISLLQNAIGNISETITVEQELSNLKNYVFINHVRYGERIKVNYFISPDCLSYQLPKLIIQPFIENAFFHAFNHKAGGYIHILVAIEGDRLICEVVDNGDGMEMKANKLPNFKNKRKLFSGIGVRNVHERIKLLYGEQYGVKISSEIGVGTKVKIQLPLLKEENITSI
ncbi:sensor histidine kinase [Lederbergia citrea]|uniref:Sensor histidine kinase n=1 Tax=Lederbergia citrea TaxID=2833581 RepID=A0A942UVE2_9BACI|nr:histidine kinase [Lederbergia citrea]MBS4205937.1 sensor histidine kinase [Lederbergia citrea]MBS4224614.1 sensor histidine kinase [Lederbergia citrea]